jgi:hypothetical protein
MNAAKGPTLREFRKADARTSRITQRLQLQ